MGKKLKSAWFSISLFVFSLLVLLPKKTFAVEDKVSVSRSEMLDVAKEIHPPGCTDSMTADYCTLITGYEVRQEITSLMETGMNKEEVIDFLVQKYGERILAYPVPEGFNLVVWALPAIGIAFGAVLIALLIKKWKKSQEESKQSSPQNTVLSAGEASNVQEELKNWL